MHRRIAFLVAFFTCTLSGIRAHAQYDAFVSINGVKSIDQPLETVILTENLATVDVILRDSGGGFLSDAFANGGGGVQSVNVKVDISGGTSTGSDFKIEVPGVTVGSFIFGDQSSPKDPDPPATSGVLRGGTGNLFSVVGNPAMDVGGGVYEAVLGSFTLNYDLSTAATIALDVGGDDGLGFFNGVNREGFIGGGIENLDDAPFPLTSLINFHAATVMSTPIPEPSSLAMVGLASVGLIRRRRRRARRCKSLPAAG